MIDLNLGGACPRRPLTYALARAMKHPNGPLDVELGPCDLGVVATNGTMSEGIEALARMGLLSRGSWLIASFLDEATTLCSGLVLLLPTDGGIFFSIVEPCVLRAGAPMILVTADRTHAFGLTAAGRLIERPVPRPARVRDGIERGRADLVRRMRALTTDGGAFRYESWEVHIMPTG